MNASRRRLFFPLAAGAGIFFAAACGKKAKRAAAIPAAPSPAVPSTATPAQPRASSKQPPLPVGYVEEGVASWYGIPYHGRKAADGETFDMETLVAAHRTMPFNTWLRVTNLANNKAVTVRVIDRGPFVEGRVLDLSKAAAREIDLIGPGIGKVRMQVIGAPADIPADDFYAVQVGAFSIYENAERVRLEHEKRFGTAKLVEQQGTIPIWRVLVGKEASMDAAQRLANSMSGEKRDVFVVRLDEKLPKPVLTPPPPPLPAGKVWQTPDNVTFDPRETQNRPR